MNPQELLIFFSYIIISYFVVGIISVIFFSYVERMKVTPSDILLGAFIGVLVLIAYILDFIYTKIWCKIKNITLFNFEDK